MWGDDTGGAVKGKCMWKTELDGEKKKETKDRADSGYSPIFLYRLLFISSLTSALCWGWELLICTTADSVGEQLADCLPHFYQVIFSIKEKS